ncbi:hypothetical protein SNOG_15515 [Parastagonospora nodorum SN15]|uniref:Uncharacterized protein n=1 Tax=Phaeosphaeria nodorum (strain SN15 / ATCC MYA-4574 / FGSC 10173) TaxID=321614 RepID=Q0TYH3_PHANO|nr:hypothetical protein SNOG_15515 [Parastagonospora nodorum SN15]EAT77180.1 hypothetical protein SNOG_15515 [Parastagonospora nodorum SN15]
MSATFDLTRGKCVEEEEKLVLYGIGRCAPRFHFLSGLKRIVELLKAPWPLATGEPQNLSRCRGEVQATQKGRDGSLWGSSELRAPSFPLPTSTLSVHHSEIRGIVLAALHQLHLRYKQGPPSPRSLQFR